MACITTTEGRRDAARAVWMEKVASTGPPASSAMRLYDIRHATATLLLKRGGPIQDVGRNPLPR